LQPGTTVDQYKTLYTSGAFIFVLIWCYFRGFPATLIVTVGFFFRAAANLWMYFKEW
jgi:hypothetical protein